MTNILIIAFDGLDYELIREYECQNLQQTEFGKIDNHSGISSIKTSELFASFITGETSEVHGVTGLSKWTNSWINWFENTLGNRWPLTKFSGIRGAIWSSIRFLGAKKRRYIREDLDAETLFDQVPESKALFVPAYNPSWFFTMGVDQEPLNYGASLEETQENWEKEFIGRRELLFQEMGEEHNLLMHHFHKPDIWHHLYAYDNEVHNEEKIRKLYEEMDELAAEIKEEAEDYYDLIIFMSDHGLPTEKEHNKNAFYSSNKKLELDKPKITDFYEIIISKTEQSDVLDIDI